MKANTLSLWQILHADDIDAPTDYVEVQALLRTVDALEGLFLRFPDAPRDLVARKEAFKAQAYRLTSHFVEPL